LKLALVYRWSDLPRLAGLALAYALLAKIELYYVAVQWSRSGFIYGPQNF